MNWVAIPHYRPVPADLVRLSCGHSAVLYLMGERWLGCPICHQYRRIMWWMIIPGTWPCV